MGFQISSSQKSKANYLPTRRINTFKMQPSRKHLKELFSFLNRAQKLKHLDLSYNVFSVSSAEALVESLKKLPVIEKLLLERTHMSDESMCILTNFAYEKSSITCLRLYSSSFNQSARWILYEDAE